MPRTKIFVGSLGNNPRVDLLRQLFEEYGNVTECDIVNRCGFVHMETEEQAEAAIQGLNNANFNGQTISVEWGRQKEPRSGGGGGQKRGSFGGGGGINRGGMRPSPYNTMGRSGPGPRSQTNDQRGYGMPQDYNSRGSYDLSDGGSGEMFQRRPNNYSGGLQWMEEVQYDSKMSYEHNYNSGPGPMRRTTNFYGDHASGNNYNNRSSNFNEGRPSGSYGMMSGGWGGYSGDDGYNNQYGSDNGAGFSRDRSYNYPRGDMGMRDGRGRGGSYRGQAYNNNRF